MRLSQTLSTAAREHLAATVLLVMGLTLAGVWTNTVGSSVSILPLGAETIVGIPSADAFRVGRLFTGVLFIIAARKLPKVQNTAVIIGALLMSVATAALVIAYYQTLVNAEILSLLSIFVAIACYSYLVWVFYRHFARRLPASYAVWGICISLVLEAWLSSFVLTLLSFEVQLSLALIVPLLVAVAYFCARKVDTQTPAPKPYPRISSKAEKSSLIAQVVLITVALVFIQALSEAGIWGESRGSYAGLDGFSPVQLGVVTLIVIALAFAVFHAPRKRLSLSLRCIIGFGISLVGLQILALISDVEVSPYLVSVVAAIEAFSHLVRWLMIIECVRLVSMPSYRVAGIAHSSSALVGVLWTHAVSWIALGNFALVMVMIYVLLMSVIIIFVRSYYSHNTRLWATEDTKDDSAARAFAQDYALSPRESEIFILLMQGKKYLEVEQLCSLSSGTVKTHVSNIYRKLDAHSRQEARELYNQYRSRE